MADNDGELRIRDLELNNDALQRDIAKLKAQLEEAERQEAKLVADSKVTTTVANDKVMEMTRTQEEWERKCHRATEDLSRAQETLETERESVAKLQREVRTLRLEAQSHAHDQGEVDRREEKFAKQTEELDRLKKRVGELETISKELVEEVKGKNEELQEVQDALQLREEGLVEAQRRVHELEEDNEELREELLSASQAVHSQPEPPKPQSVGMPALNFGDMSRQQNGDVLGTARTARPLGQLPTESLMQQETPRGHDAVSTRDPYSEPLLQEDPDRFGPLSEEKSTQTIAPFDYSDREEEPRRNESTCPTGCVIC
jgi:chromosome segregation ATPase